MSPLLAETLLATGLVTLAVLLLRGPVARLFGARAAYALWLAPVARMLWPLVPDLTPAAPTGGVEWIAITLEPAARAASALPSWLVPAWLGGAALYLAARLIAHHRFLSRALAEGRHVLGDYPFDLVATPAVEGPLATGLIHRLVLVPDDFGTRFTPDQQALALAHEGMHHARGDLWACTTALVLTALNWFNPIAHLALAAFRRDMEAACDAQVLAAHEGARPAYAETLLRCAARPVPRSLCALTSIDELKGRLTMLNNNPTLLRRLAGTGLAIAVAAGGLVLSLPAAAEPGAKDVKTFKIVSEGKEGGTWKITQDKPADGRQVRKEVRVIELRGADGKKMEWSGKDGERPTCAGTPTEVTAGSQADGKKEQAKIFICAKSGTSKAEQVKHLEEAIGRLQANTDMDAAIRADLVAKLQGKVAELKAQP